MVDDVEEAIEFYTSHLGFAALPSSPPAFADVMRGQLRLLLRGPHRVQPAGRCPTAANRDLAAGTASTSIVDDIAGEVERLRSAGS